VPKSPHPAASGTPELLTVARACEYSGISKTVLYALGHKQRVDFRKLGRRAYVTRASLDALIQALPAAPCAAAA
jgi:excisionase family DNA binding protein